MNIAASLRKRHRWITSCAAVGAGNIALRALDAPRTTLARWAPGPHPSPAPVEGGENTDNDRSHKNVNSHTFYTGVNPGRVLCPLSGHVIN